MIQCAKNILGMKNRFLPFDVIVDVNERRSVPCVCVCVSARTRSLFRVTHNQRVGSTKKNPLSAH